MLPRCIHNKGVFCIKDSVELGSLSKQLIGDSYFEGDDNEYFGFMYLTHQNISIHKHPFSHTNTLRYPNGFDYSYGYDGAFAVLTGAILYFFVDLPLAYNLTLFLIIFFNIYLSLIAFKLIAKKLEIKDKNIGIKTLISAIIYGASPYVFARLNGHLNLAFIAGIPLFAYSLLAFYVEVKNSNIRLKTFYYFLASIIITLLGSLQYVVLLLFLIIPFAFYILGTIKPHKIILSKKAFLRKYFVRASALFVVFLSVFAYFWGSYFIATISGKLLNLDSEKLFKLNILDIFMPNGYLGNFWHLLNASAPSIESIVTVGTVEIILFFIFLIVLKNKKIKVALSFLFIIYLALAFGTVSIPYFPEGGRFVLLFSLGLSVLVLLMNTVSKKVWLTILVLLVLERFSFVIHISPPFPLKTANIVKETPGEVALTVPFSKYSTTRSTLPYLYNKKIVGGYFHYTADKGDASEYFYDGIITRLNCNWERAIPLDFKYTLNDKKLFVDELRRLGISTVVLDKGFLSDKFYNDACSSVRNWWYYINPPTLELADDTVGVQKINFIIPANNPNAKVAFEFLRSGRMNIYGIIISPSTELSNTTIVLPDGSVVLPEWVGNNNNELIADYKEPLAFNVNPGDESFITKTGSYNMTKFITVYYDFDQYDNTEPVIKPVLEKVYETDQAEIYVVNDK